MVQQVIIPRDCHFTATSGTTGHNTKGLSLHCYIWYNKLQYQGTECHFTVTAGTTDCSTKGLNVTSLLHLVQQAAVQRDWMSLHCYIWYNKLQYQGTECHFTATAGTTDCSTKGLNVTSLLHLVVQQAAVPREWMSLHCYSWCNRLQYQGTECHFTATAGTTGCSTKGLNVTSLLHLVQQAIIPRDSVSYHSYKL